MYNFIDTTERTVSADALPSEAISLDGEYIDSKIEGFRTLAVSGRESIEYNVSDEDMPAGYDGMEYYGKRMPARNLIVKFQLKADTAELFMQRYRALKKFCSGEGRLIRFADEPNAHYTGTLTEIEKPDSGLLSVISTMTFYCSNPYLVSDIITTVQASDVNGILTADVNNDGSASTFPVYRITHSSENGYIGIVHSGGAMEIGNIEEADTEAYARNETLFTGLTGFADYSGAHPQNGSIALNGKLTIGGDNRATFTTRGSSAYWTAGCKKITLPADSNGIVGAENFYCWFSSHFITGAFGQTGLQQIIFTDESDSLIAAFQICKLDMTGNTAYASFIGPDGNELRSFEFQPALYGGNHFNYDNDGCNDFLKQGSSIRFYYGGYYSYDFPEIASKKVTNIYIVVGDWSASGKYISVNDIGKLIVQKQHVSKLKDVPNRYPSGSEVVIDTSDDSIKVDGMPRESELVTGSEFASIPPGESKVEFYTSTWCAAKPNVTVEFRKRWL